MGTYLQSFICGFVCQVLALVFLYDLNSLVQNSLQLRSLESCSHQEVVTTAGKPRNRTGFLERHDNLMGPRRVADARQ